MGMSLVSPTLEFPYGRLYSFACALTGKKTREDWVAERSGKEIFVAVSRGQKRRNAQAGECVFANVGAVLKPPLMKLFRSSDEGSVG